MKRINFFFSCLLLCLSITARAQLIQDIAGAGVSVNADNKFTDVPAQSTLLNNQFSVSTYEMWLPLFPPTLKNTRIFSNINYRYLDFNYENSTANDEYALDNISEIRAQVVVISPISKKLSILAVTIPTVASDFKGPFSSDDLILDGIYGITKKFGKNSNLEIGFGVHVMYSFGEFIVTPGISVDYQSTDKKWIAQFYWPRLNVLHNFSKNTQFGLSATIDWTKFNMKNFVNPEGTTVDYAQYSTIRSSLQFNQRLYRNFWLQLQGGMGLFNSYKAYDSDNESVIDLGFDSKPYAKLMLTYRID